MAYAPNTQGHVDQEVEVTVVRSQVKEERKPQYRECYAMEPAIPVNSRGTMLVSKKSMEEAGAYCKIWIVIAQNCS